MPSNNAVNGPKNCLLQMDNVELDENGALRLIRGRKQIGSNYANPATDIFSNVISNVTYNYVADNTGSVFRNGTLLFSGGSTTRTAFGIAYEYTLIASGNEAFKNTTSANFTLGIDAPITAPSVSTTFFETVGFPTSYSTVDTTGSSVNSGGVLQITTSTTPDSNNFNAVTQSSTVTPPNTDFWDMRDNLTGHFDAPGYTSDIMQLTITSNTIGSLATILRMNFYWLTDAGPSSGLPVANYYQLVQLENADFVQYYSNPTSTTEQFQTYVRRYDFTPVGAGAATSNWGDVKGFRVELQQAPSSPSITINFEIGGLFFGGGANAPQVIGTDANRPNTGTSTVSYLQVDVRQDGSYTGFSSGSPSASFTQINGYYSGVINITPPTDPQVTEVWLFRQDDELNQWYRVAVLGPADWTKAWVDNTSDQTALSDDITFDATVGNVSDILPILAILGPLEGRWFYCTSQFIYPTPINNPDSVDITNGIKIAGINSEVFMWAKIISFNGILVGTSHDVYILTGTFITLPDGTIDVYYRPLACKYPPVAYDADVYNSTVYYMAKDGWRSIDDEGNCILICAPATDILYQGIPQYGYTPLDLKGIMPGEMRFPVLTANNKFYGSATGCQRMDVYDFVRQYWKPVKYGADVLALCSSPGGFTEAFFSLGLYSIDTVS